MATKLPYEGEFNINNETYNLSTDAFSKAQAKLFMARKIAYKKKINPGVVLGYLETHPNSYEIKIKQ